MKETTIDLIRTVLYSDETVSREHQDSILRACRQTAIRRKLIGAKAAMEILHGGRMCFCLLIHFQEPAVPSAQKNEAARLLFTARRATSLKTDGFLH